MLRALRLLLGSAFLAVLAPAACSDETSGAGGAGPGGPTSTGTQGAGAGGSGGGGGAGGGGGGASACGGESQCAATFTFTPPAGATNVRVAGEWHGFDLATATALTGPDAAGAYTAAVTLPPGLHAYKFVYDQNGGTSWVLDPEQGRRKYVGGTENSAIKVRDCRLPVLTDAESQVSRPAAGQGSYEATLAYLDGSEGAGPAPEAFEAVLDRDGEAQPLAAPELGVDEAGNVTVSLAGLDDGKYRVILRPRTRTGCEGEPVRLVFWVEAEPFSWEDALIYMVVTDRYRDGAPGNNPGPTPESDPRGDWLGGDLEGLLQSIEEGKLDELGVRALWLTPFQTNPTAAFLAADGVHKVTGYHGYWPTRAREVDPRIGGADALRAVVRAAHARGIRILQDFVVNHVHEEHEYFAAHPGWFHQDGCVCGTPGCDWTEHALDCWFASYMPDIDHTVPEANAAFVDDAVWWLDEFNLDGLRVDAVKHVEEVATRNLAAAVRETFEAAGTRHFLMGETAMGWSDCGDPCNDENYDTIARYIGPHGLDGQFDFVLYHGVSYRTFAHGDRGMIHADYWTQHGLARWPEGAIMTPYLGSHDTARFTTLADYRGQDAAHDRGIPGNQWSNTANAPADGEPYARTRVAMAWLLGLPGAPLLYYGDEYGQWGGADPNNRLMWRDGAALTAEEQATLAFVRKLGAARQEIAPLRRGDYVSLAVTEDTLVYGRKMAPGQGAIVALTRAGQPATISAQVADAAKLGFPPGTALQDRLGGGTVTVQPDGTVTLTVPARSAMILAP